MENKSTKKQKKERADEIIARLKSEYPDAHCALHHSNPEQLLIATVLSAQCTDERVNQVTPHLFEKYPKMKDLARADLADVEKLVHSTGFYKNKAKNLIALAQKLVKDHKGVVPQDLDYLIGLPGVGRKTANVVLGNSFGIPSGIVVDTHVTRLSQRLGLTVKTGAIPIEQDLMNWVKQEDWILFSHWLITHGRAICNARKPDCQNCFLEDICPKKIG
jgi:endonuclease III